jgi:hypothetical protein
VKRPKAAVDALKIQARGRIETGQALHESSGSMQSTPSEHPLLNRTFQAAADCRSNAKSLSEKWKSARHLKRSINRTNPACRFELISFVLHKMSASTRP